MPDAAGRILGASIPRVPWHEKPVYPLMPYQYEIVFALFDQPLTAGEMCHEPFARECGASPLSMASRMRPLVKRGWISRDDSGIYRVTPWARSAMCRS